MVRLMQTKGQVKKTFKTNKDMYNILILNNSVSKKWNKKIWHVMRLYLFFILLGLAPIHAAMYSQTANLNIQVKNQTLRDALKQIEQASELYFFMNDNLDAMNQRVSIDVQDESFDFVMNTVLQGHGLSYRMYENNVVVITEENVFQGISITGTVTDTYGDPLPGVTVMIKGTTQGTATGSDGAFSLQVSDGNATLVFSYVGFVTREIVVGDQRAIRVTLNEDTQMIDEVVVIGYGVQRKVNLTGSVATVNVEKELESRPLTNLSMALSGAAPGLTVMQTSGRPNSDGATILIRGLGTLNSSGPLILVDGMEQGFAGVNPMDVATISVLKDAASCAIYGNRGANGVILITTKQGVKGKTNVNYSGNFSYNQPANLIQLVSNGAEYMKLYNEGMTNIGGAQQFMNETIKSWEDAEKNPNGIAASGYPNYVAYPNTDWYKEVYQSKMMQEHSVSILGTSDSDKIKFNFSGAYLDNPGTIDGAGLKSYRVRSNVIVDVTNWLQVGNRSYGYHSDIGNANVDGYLDNGWLTNHKNDPLIYPYYDGKYGGTGAAEDDAGIHNPKLVLDNRGGTNTQSQINSAMFANIKLFKDFTYHINFDWKRYWGEQASHYKGYGKYNFAKDTWSVPPDPLNTLNSWLVINGSKVWRFLQTLKYDKNFGMHEVGALAGYEENSVKSYNATSTKTGLLDVAITDLSATTAMTGITGTNAGYTARSWFGRATYGYKSRYLVEANIRYDGSSRFAPDSRWGLFPAFSAAWRITEEDFMTNTLFDNLKLRASWGRLGNNSIGNYDWQATYTSVSMIQGPGEAIVPGLYQGTLANTNLKWETTTNTNVGVDISMLKNRLVAEIDIYNRLTEGILYRPNIYQTLGVKTGPMENIAEVSNKGLEISLGWNDRIDQVTYGIRGNFSANKNRVIKYRGKLEEGWITDANGNKVYQSNLGEVTTGGSTRVVEGHIISEWYVLNTYKGDQTYKNADGSVNINGGPKDGMIRTEQDMEWLQAMRAAGYTFYPSQNIAKNALWYGDYIYADTNGDGIYGNTYDNDFQNASNLPKYNFGFQTYASWKNLDFSMNWSGAAGFKLYWCEVGKNNPTTTLGYAIPKPVADTRYFYDPENPNDPRTNLNTKTPRIKHTSGGAQNTQVSTLWLEKGDYLKLRNITLGYSLPNNLSSKLYAQNIRFFVSGENLLCITGFSGMDPEMRTAFGYVTMRQFAFGLNVTF